MPTPTPSSSLSTRSVHLHTLGTVELREGEAGEAPLLALGKPLALLIYLSAAPGRSASRSLLISLLWSDLEPDAAKHALRQTLWYIRRKVGRDLLVATTDTLQLVADLAVDRDALLAASAASRHEDVVARYAGPFVPNFATPGGSGFEDWCALERRRLLQVFRHAAEAIIADHLARGRARAALDLARRLRDQDPYDESGWRLLLEVCASANDTLAARAEAEALVQLADREELQLAPATRALLKVVRAPSTDANGTVTVARLGIQAGTLVGREHAFAEILGAWEQVRAGAMRRLHVTGRAGLGKSRLLRDVEARLRAMRGRVAAVGASHGAREVSYAVAGELAAALAKLPGRRAIAPASAATLIELNPSLSTWFDDAPRAPLHDDLLRARTQALRELAGAVAFEQPVAILIDDLHWVDDASLALLGALADALRDARILLVTTGRAEARQAAVASHADTTHVTLDALTPPQVEELVLSIAAIPAEPWATEFAPELWRASRGSPLLALETLQLLEDRGVLARVDGTWHTDRPEALLGELRAGDAVRGRLEDMARGDRWLLTLLAANGAAVAEGTLIDASDRPADEVRERLRQLESRALVLRSGDAWQVTHDEIADETLRLAGPDGVTRAAARLGRAMLAARVWDERLARRTAQLLRSSGEASAKGEVFRRFARQRFALGDRRPLEALAADLFGPAPRDEDVRAVVAASPLSWRLGLVSPLRLAAAIAGIVALFAVSALALTRRPPPPPPDAVLGLAIIDSAGHLTFQQAELREAEWSPLEPLATTPWGVIPPFDPVSTNAFAIVRRPGHDEVLTTQSVEDSGVVDLFLRGRTGLIRRVASAPGDEGVAQFSPRGQRLVFNTARWDSLSRYDLALYDFGTESLERLTSGPATDDWPVWSPNGSQIAFSRDNWGETTNELCVMSMATRFVTCHPVRQANEAYPIGWIDEDRILVVLSEDFRRRLVALQWSTQEIVLVRDGAAHWYSVSPDARWAYCTCEVAADGTMRPAVFPINATTFTRPLRIPGLSSRSTVVPFWISSDASLPASRLRIVGPRRAPGNVPLLLTAHVTDARGREIKYHGSVRWSVADPAAARIDSLTGRLVLSGRTSQVVVRATAGSIAHDSLVMELTPSTTRLLFEETWRDSSLTNWWSFGAPPPTTRPAADGTPAMRNNGEGSFESGVLSRRQFNTDGGLAVDLRVSTRVTMKQWQAMHLTIFTDVDTTLYLERRGRNVSPNEPITGYACSAGYPVEGRRRGKSSLVTVSTSRTLTLPPPSPTLMDGSWHTVRIQLLPDGSCGVAIDGIPMGIVPGTPTSARAAHVRISGNSYRTDMLAGRLRVYEGVPTDVDWSQAVIVRP